MKKKIIKIKKSKTSCLPYKTKSERLSGTNFGEVNEKVQEIYNKIWKNKKRRPFIRSAYFNKEKIFLAQYWKHLFEKENWRDRVRRLKFFPAGIELIKNSKIEPSSKENPNETSEILHRFLGITADKYSFIVQIKEEKKNGKKYLMSIFPK